VPSRVLVVDDDLDIAEAIADVLRSGGYQPLIAADGNEALAHGSVEMVLLDWRLPTPPAGVALVRKLRELSGPNLPILVLSADPASLAEAREAQVDDDLPKPFEAIDLLHLVDQYCR
jgi:DNA-binding response OmpR family regulator